jgi:hypothetical protein
LQVYNLIFILNAGNEVILQEKDGAECHVRQIMYGTRTNYASKYQSVKCYVLITVLISCTYFWHGKLDKSLNFKLNIDLF